MFTRNGDGSILGFRKSKTADEPEMPAAPQTVKAAAQPTLSNSSQHLGGAIRALGGRNEALRIRCESVLSTVTAFRSASTEVEALFREFGAIATELQEKSNALDETRAALAVETLTKQELAEDNTALRTGGAKTQSENELLSSELANSERRCETFEETLRNTQLDLKDRSETLKAVEAERTAVMARAQQLANEGARLSEKLKESEAALDEAKSQRRAAEDKFQFELQERLKLAEGNKELANMYTQEKKNFLEASTQLEKAKHKASEIEAQLNTATADADTLRAALRTSESRRETDEVGFILKIETLNSRLELTEQLLARAREEAHRLGEEQLLHGEANRKLQQSQGEIEELNAKLEKSFKRASDLEQSRDTINARANDLLNELREKRSLNEQAAERIASLQKFSASLQAEKTKDIDKLKDQVKQLTESLAKEHAAREYAEGSLQAARRDRTQLQNTIAQLENARLEKSGLPTIEIVPAAKDLADLQAKLEDGGKDNVENLPRPQGAA